MRFRFKIMSPGITAPLFVSPCDVPLTVCPATNWKILSGRKDLHEITQTPTPADCVSHLEPAAATPPGFLNKCLELWLK